MPSKAYSVVLRVWLWLVTVSALLALMLRRLETGLLLPAEASELVEAIFPVLLIGCGFVGAGTVTAALELVAVVEVLESVAVSSFTVLSMADKSALSRDYCEFGLYLRMISNSFLALRVLLSSVLFKNSNKLTLVCSSGSEVLTTTTEEERLSSIMVLGPGNDVEMAVTVMDS